MKSMYMYAGILSMLLEQDELQGSRPLNDQSSSIGMIYSFIRFH